MEETKDLKESINQAWDLLGKINKKPAPPKVKQITEEEKAKVNARIKYLRQKGWTPRRIKRDILRNFKVKIID